MSYLGIALPVLGHEFWLEPEEFQVETGATLKVQLRNGQEFKGVEIGYFEKRTEIFDWFQNETRNVVQSRTGDFPALTMPANEGGLMVLAYESTASTLQYNGWAKFQAFADHKDFPDAEAMHKQRGLSMDRFLEVYTRYCKTLIGIGDAAGQDTVTSMETEFVALRNPYIDDLSAGFPVQLLYQGAPRRAAQVEVFERDPDGAVVIALLRTDDNGHALVPVKPGHVYLLDAVVLREPEESSMGQEEIAWETLWASMTFSVPQ